MKEIEFTDLPKENFFYPLIATLAYSIHGMLDLFSRGFTLGIKSLTQDDSEYQFAIEQAANKMQLNKSVVQSLKSFQTFTPIMLAPGFNKLGKDESIYFDADKVALELLHPGLEKIYHQIVSIAKMTITTGFDNIMEFNLKDSEVLQFFRHIRNAAAHNGKFHFTKKVLDSNGELLKIAKWKDFEIKSNLQNKKLFTLSQTSTDKFWDLGDLIDFLIDFESCYPEVNTAS